ncbi:MAG: hypothetical protein WBJ68_01840 [Candidatus Dechloromonas phosphoritropha]
MLSFDYLVRSKYDDFRFSGKIAEQIQMLAIGVSECLLVISYRLLGIMAVEAMAAV